MSYHSNIDNSRATFFTEKPLNKVRPSQLKNSNRVQLLFKKLLNLFLFKKPDSSRTQVKNILNLTGKGTSSDSIHFSDLNTLYHPFLPKNKELTKALNQMEKDENARMSFNEKTKLHLTEKKIKQIHQLKDGEIVSLALEHDRLGTSPSLILMIQKQQTGYTVKLLGTKNTLEKISPDQMINGKKRKAISLSFEGVPPKLLNSEEFESFIKEWAFYNTTEESTQQFVESLKAFRKSDHRFAVSSNRIDKLFWNLMSQFELPSKLSPEKALVQEKKLKLKAEVALLFQTFQKSRTHLTNNSPEYYELQSILSAVARSVNSAYHKNYLTEEELGEITGELKIIQNALIHASKEKNGLISSRISHKKALLKKVFWKNFRIHEQQGVQTQVTEPISLPKVSPPKDLFFKGIQLKEPLPNSKDILSKEQLFEWIEKIKKDLDNPNPLIVKHEVMNFFRNLSFSREEELNFAKVCEQLNPTEALDFMSLITTCTKQVFPKERPVLSQYEFEVLFRMAHLSKDILGMFTRLVAATPKDEITLIPLKMSSIPLNDLYDFSTFKYNNLTKKNYARSLTQFHTDFEKVTQDIFTYPIGAHFSKSQIAALTNCFTNMMSHIKNLLSLSYFFPIEKRFVLKNFFIQEQPQGWIKPFHDPFLESLFFFSKTFIGPDTSNPEHINLITPEFLQMDPEFAIEKFYQFLKSTRKDKTLSIPLRWNKLELQALFRLIRGEKPQAELFAFMKEYPHLLDDVETRNFFNALFFDLSLQHTLKVPKNRMSSDNLTKLIDEEIDSLMPSINDSTIKENQFEKLLFFHEMHQRLLLTHESLLLRENKIPPLKNTLEKLVDFCETHPPYQKYLGQIATIRLRHLIEGMPDDQSEEHLAEVIKNYSLHFAYPTDVNEKEPYFEEKLKWAWIDFAERIIASSQFSIDPIKSLLNAIACGKNLDQGHQDWEQVNQEIFENDLYKINLKTLEVIAKSDGKHLVQLPEAVLQHPLFRKIENLNEIQNIAITHQKTKSGKDIYSYIDGQGFPTQLESQKGLNLYKKFPFAKEKWLQCISYSVEDKQTPDLKQQILKSFFSCLSSDVQSSAVFKDLGVFVDPKNKNQGYCINSQGELVFSVHFSQSKHGLEVKEIIDHRTSPPKTPMQLHSGLGLPVEARHLLLKFENSENILVWSQKGHVKDIELPRYGLNFTINQGKLFCQTHPFKGYYVDANATASEKQGFEHFLLLKHPDPNKPFKLIAPPSNSMTLEQSVMKFEAKGFGKLAIPFYLLKQAIGLYRSKNINKIPTQTDWKIDPELDQIPIISFDVRPFTNELLSKINADEEKTELFGHAIISHNIPASVKLLNTIKKEGFEPKNIPLWMKFIQKTITGTDFENAIQLKIAIELKTQLQDEKKLSKQNQQILDKVLSDLGYKAITGSKKIPSSLQLTESENQAIETLIQSAHRKKYQAFKKSIKEVTDVKVHSHVDSKISSISQLEETIKTDQRLSDRDLSSSIPQLKAPVAILFQESEIKQLFTEEKQTLPSFSLPMKENLKPHQRHAFVDFNKELELYKNEQETTPNYSLSKDKKELKNFNTQTLIPTIHSLTNTLNASELKLKLMLSTAPESKEQIELLGAIKATVTFEELRIAFAKDNLHSLFTNGQLPTTVNQEELVKELRHYFTTLSKRNACQASMRHLEMMISRQATASSEEWVSLSNQFHQLLTLKRYYDAEEDPRPLIFEAQQFLNFKPLEGGLDQLELLQTLLSNPTSVVQAPTGAGKTSILSVMRSLHKANGQNLVIQKVLPHLYNQTYDKLQDTLGDLFGLSVYALKFDLTVRLVEEEITQVYNAKKKTMEDKKTETSVFKSMYHNLLLTIENKGCVLTDYKSLPLLEEMLWKVSQEILENTDAQTPVSDVLTEHHEYLKKILILLENKADINMDEHDEPTKSNQKIQIDLGIGGKPVPEWIIDATLELFQNLMENKELKLSANIQSDISQTMRDQALKEVAKKLADRFPEDIQEDVFHYFNGNDVLLSKASFQKLNPEMKDKIVLIKDQIQTYLGLTLSNKGQSRYARSENGKKIVTAVNGLKQTSKFGTLLEQMNYTFQDFIQQGITPIDLQNWVSDLKIGWNLADEMGKKTYEEQFHALLPNASFKDIMRIKNFEDFESYCKEINQNPQSILFFTRLNLLKMQTSGALISMDPENIADMSRVSSGTSATVGAKEAMHRSLTPNEEINRKVRANMAYRLLKRNLDPTVLKYDPANPQELLKKTPVQCIIDGAGVFNQPGAHVAQQLLDANPNLKQVGFIGKSGAIEVEGTASSQLEKTGFVFQQGYTRGTDVALDPNTKALLTLSSKDGLRDFFQKEGRLRLANQKYQLAISEFQEDIHTLQDVIAQALINDADTDAQDIYRHLQQEMKGIVRRELKKKLLSLPREAFIAEFRKKEIHALFITDPEPNFDKPGEYFKQRQSIDKKDALPKDELEKLQTQQIAFAEANQLTQAVAELKALKFEDPLLNKLETQVTGSSKANDLNHEIEQEEEQDFQQDLQQDLQLQLQLEDQQEEEQFIATSSGRMNVPKRLYNGLTHNLSSKHAFYSNKIALSDSFIPLSRANQATYAKRELFDQSMYRIGIVTIKLFSKDAIDKITIEDPLGDLEFYDLKDHLYYDIRTGKIVSRLPSYITENELMELVSAYIPQIKFFDGRITGYTNEEKGILRDWILANDPKTLYHHLLNDVLKYRHQEKIAFPQSQLGQLFKEIDPSLHLY